MNDDSLKFPVGGDGEARMYGLGDHDREALDALVDAGFEAGAVAPELRERAGRIGAILGLVDSGGTSAGGGDRAEALIDLTLMRVMMDSSRKRGRGGETLSPSDEDALEALIGADYDPAEVAAPLRRRASRQADLLALLEPARAEVSGSEARIARTLRAVQSSIDARERTMRLEPATVRGKRFRMADVLTAAALLLIASAAIGPMVGAMQEQARRTACQSGLRSAGQGLASYAAEWKDSLPLATASVAGNPWWFVGVPEKSNSANLYKTVSAGYTKIEDLACAGNAAACREQRGSGEADWRTLGEVSYSYQNMFARERPRWNGETFLVLVDASPVVRRAIQGRLMNPFANTANHGGAGQNALFSDGGVVWLRSPVLANGDNIWLPGSAERRIGLQRQPTEVAPIEGTESPDAANDAFVGP
ncbi:MAG: hypothetical protein ACK4WH_08295 [Phycisphaerales bacterium]